MKAAAEQSMRNSRQGALPPVGVLGTHSFLQHHLSAPPHGPAFRPEYPQQQQQQRRSGATCLCTTCLTAAACAASMDSEGKVLNAAEHMTCYPCLAASRRGRRGGQKQHQYRHHGHYAPSLSAPARMPPRAQTWTNMSAAQDDSSGSGMPQLPAMHPCAGHETANGQTCHGFGGWMPACMLLQLPDGHAWLPSPIPTVSCPCHASLWLT